MQMTGMSRDWVYEVFRVPAKGGIQPIKMGNSKNAPLRWYTWQVKAYIASLAEAAERR
jgi:predicted DNA-binding transcriptional regulator AlpA